MAVILALVCGSIGQISSCWL